MAEDLQADNEKKERPLEYSEGLSLCLELAHLAGFESTTPGPEPNGTHLTTSRKIRLITDAKNSCEGIRI